MNTVLPVSTLPGWDVSSETLWATLYQSLLPPVKRWVYAANMLSWANQEIDVAWDIVLTAVKKTYEFVLRAQQERIPIVSLERLSIVIAKNYFHDLRRKDSRLLHFDTSDSSQGEESLTREEDDFSETVNDRMYEEWVLMRAAQEIASFPARMRTAVLIDIARRMDFDETEANPTPLQRAFLDAGIRLQEYRGLLPTDPVARARISSLASLAYKRLARLAPEQ